MSSIAIVLRDPTPDEARIRELLKFSTRHKDEENYEAAIACLREAYRLMEGVSTTWGFREYFRLPRCLHMAGRYDEAIAELQRLHDDLAAYEQRRKASGFHPLPAQVQRNIREMIKREIDVTRVREGKLQKHKLTAKTKRRK